MVYFEPILKVDNRRRRWDLTKVRGVGSVGDDGRWIIIATAVFVFASAGLVVVVAPLVGGLRPAALFAHDMY